MWERVKHSVKSWLVHDPFASSAAISYYTIFSFPALLIILMAIASLLLDRDYVKDKLTEYLNTMVGAESTQTIMQAMENTALESQGVWAFVVGGGVLLYAAVRLFVQLQKVLNKIWGVKPAHEIGFQRRIIRRIISLGVMLAVGFVMLVSLLATMFLTALGQWITQLLEMKLQWLLLAMNFGLAFLTIALLFATILKMLPDARVRWRYALQGGAVAAFLFMIGQYGLGIYFDMAKPQSAYGVTGSIILFMLWVSYSCMILLYGAEFSKACADADGEKVQPAEGGELDTNSDASS